MSALPFDFTGRTDILTSLARTIDSIAKRQQNNLIYNLYGVTGIGKTWLTYTFFEQIFKLYPCLWVSFEPYAPLPKANSKPAETSAKEGIFERLSQISIINLDSARNIISLFESVTVSSQDNFNLFDVAEIEHKPTILILDGVNRLEYVDVESGVLWEIIQSEVIAPFLSHPFPFVYCVSQVPLRFHFINLREECYTFSIDPFTKEEVQQVLAKHSLTNYTDVIYNMTGGHPLSVTYIVQRHLSRHKTAQYSNDSEQVDSPRPSRYNDIKEINNRLDLFSRDMLAHCGVLRRIDVDAIQSVLLQLSTINKWRHSTARHEINNSLAVMYHEGLIVAMKKGKPLQFEDAVRDSVSFELSESNNFETSLIIYRELEDWYGQQQRRGGRQKVPYFTEWMYFSLKHLQSCISHGDLISKQGNIENSITKWKAKFTEHYNEIVKISEIQQGLKTFSFHQLAEPENSTGLNMQQLFQQGNRNIVEQIRGEIESDHQIGILAQSLGLKSFISRVLGISFSEEQLEFPHDELLDELANYLFQERFPRSLSQEERNFLIWLAKEFPASGFTIAQTQEKVQHLNLAISHSQLRSLINFFHGIHIINYNSPSRKYAFQSWLYSFLQQLPNPGGFFEETK